QWRLRAWTVSASSCISSLCFQAECAGYITPLLYHDDRTRGVVQVQSLRPREDALTSACGGEDALTSACGGVAGRYVDQKSVRHAWPRSSHQTALKTLASSAATSTESGTWHIKP